MSTEQALRCQTKAIFCDLQHDTRKMWTQQHIRISAQKQNGKQTNTVTPRQQGVGVILYSSERQMKVMCVGEKKILT